MRESSYCPRAASDSVSIRPAQASSEAQKPNTTNGLRRRVQSETMPSGMGRIICAKP